MADQIDVEKMFSACAPLTRELDEFFASRKVDTDVVLAALGRLIGSRGGDIAAMQNRINIVCTFASLEALSRKAYAEDQAGVH